MTQRISSVREKVFSVRLSPDELAMLRELTGKGQTASGVFRSGLFLLRERRGGGNDRDRKARVERPKAEARPT